MTRSASSYTLSSLIRDPFVRAAFEAAERDGLAPAPAIINNRPSLNGGEAKSPRAIKARLEVLAFERSLDRSEIRKASRSGKAAMAFAQRHAVSLDWLLNGDLKGLLRTVQWAGQTQSA